MGYEDAIGLTVVDLQREGDDLVLVTSINEPDIVLTPYGDCCSTTWIESIDLTEPLLYAVIKKIEDIDMPEGPHVGTINHPHVDVVAYYGLRITTNKGISVIDYRNDSNGYYGGSLELSLRPKPSKRIK